MNNTIKWGVIGCGNIAQKFVSDLQYVENSTLYAVASKNKERAKSFAKKHNAEKCYNNYDQLVNNEKVAEILKNEVTFLICKGGRGGRGKW